MKCRNCGKSIPSGTMCEECYEKMKEKREGVEDKKILLKITKKFLPKYEIVSNIEWLVFCVFVVLCSIATNNIPVAIFGFLFSIFLFLLTLIISKRIALNSKCSFFETKMIYTVNFLFIKRTKVIYYKDIDDIFFYQGKLDKKFDMGTLVVKRKDTQNPLKSIRFEKIQNSTFKKISQEIGPKIFKTEV